MSNVLSTSAGPTHATGPHRPSLWGYLARAVAVARSRRDLAHLEPHQLDDIGLSHSAAQTEARRAPWDVPQHWLSGC